MKYIKKTYGISLCRYNNNKVEILMIRKRYTYAFFTFVFGHYKYYNKNKLKKLFNCMTLDEKLDILNLDFGMLWYRIWLINPEKFCTEKKNTYYNLSNIDIIHNLLFYNNKKEIFENFFIKRKNMLEKIIKKSNNYELEWEIPKGGVINNENPLSCACRELVEETDIKYYEYGILYNVNPIKYKINDNNTKYLTDYYVAYLKNNATYIPHINYNNKNQVFEISDIKWFNKNEIIDKKKSINKHIVKKYETIEKLFNIIIKKFKSNIKQYYYSQP